MTSTAEETPQEYIKTMKERMDTLQHRYPKNLVKQLIACFSTHTTYEGNKSQVCDVINALKTGDKRKLYWSCRNGVPKEVRAPVWYAMATSGCTYEEVITLHSHQLYNDYWNEAEDYKQFKMNPKQKRTIEVDVVRLFPEGYEDVFTLDSVRERITRLKMMYEHQFANPGYFQGMGDIIAIFFTICYEYLLGDLTVEKYSNADKSVIDTAEAAAYVMLIYLLTNINRECPTKSDAIQFHPEALWTRILSEIKEKHLFILKDDTDIILKQQVYKLLVCFFARELTVHQSCGIYDQLMCGTCSKKGTVFDGVVQLVIAFVKNLKASGVNFTDLYSFNKASHGFFENISEERLSQLISTAWYNE